MPRSPRIEYEGAKYHVINRGNYRRDLFKVYKTGEAFEEILFKACERNDWILHAYCLMSNHYHLCIETPHGNLSIGMQWLQSVFCNRFNKFIKGRGHVFQGRYKALLIDPDDSYVGLVNYIHLNPVRAGLVKLEELKNYELSSFPKFFKKKRPDCLVSEEWLHQAGGWKDSVSGMRAYWNWLELQKEGDASKKEKLSRKFTRGWCIGSKEFKKGVLEELRKRKLRNDKAERSLVELNEANWELLLEKSLKALKKKKEDVEKEKKSSEWKKAIGYYLKSKSSVTNRFLSEQLQMGDLSNVSRGCQEYGKGNLKRCKYWKALQKA